ncbi:AAEL009459-PA [Aedes aegypti]|uniref:AAEL009459-PA n=1 Tax=Aedes aegypti TaxID=7159 RepID=Q16VQ9_AEDAE|nr:AAEL009459-PA [Aedes aegypti]
MAQSPGAASGIVCRPTKVMLCNQETYHDDLHKFYIDQQKLNREAALAFQGQQQRVANLETRTNSLESAMDVQKKINSSTAKILEDLQAKTHGRKMRKGRQKQRRAVQQRDEGISSDEGSSDEEYSDEESSDEDREKICDDCRMKLRRLTQLMDQQCKM